MKRLLAAVLGLLLLAWGIQALWITRRNVSTPKTIAESAEMKRAEMEEDFRVRAKTLEEDYSEKKHLATGSTVYDRIFNRQRQTDVELVLGIAKESFPQEWTVDVRVEEFTHFLLCLSLPPNAGRVKASDVAKLLPPLLKYCRWCLSDIAVFDGVHKCYLFFDTDTLASLVKTRTLTPEQVARITRQGETFTRFNSMTVVCKKQEMHLFVPVQVTGENGVITCYMLLDTGASTTTLSLDAFKKTGAENLDSAEQRSFSTANGYMSCPIVSRSVAVEGISKTIEVAVNQNQKDNLNLLGLNFFAGLRYLVDMPNSCVYMWHEEPPPVPNVDPATLPPAEETERKQAEAAEREKQRLHESPARPLTDEEMIGPSASMDGGLTDDEMFGKKNLSSPPPIAPSDAAVHPIEVQVSKKPWDDLPLAEPDQPKSKQPWDDLPLAERSVAEDLGLSAAAVRPVAVNAAAQRSVSAIPAVPLTVDLGGGVKMEFVWVATLKGWVGKYEVVNAEYRRFKPDHDSTAYNGRTLNGDRQPAVYVSYDDAVAFVEWINGRGGLPQGYRVRLPDGNEWMTFAQCGDGREYPWGSQWPPKYGNYSGQESAYSYKIDGYNDGFAVTCPVEQSGKNDWGLYGVGGNVWEWTSEQSGSGRVVRGASWGSIDQVNLRCACRLGGVPSTRYNYIGFRVVLLR